MIDEAKVRAVVEKQADDEGCWFSARTCAEAYLQERLRELHAAIEGTDRYGRKTALTAGEQTTALPSGGE